MAGRILNRRELRKQADAAESTVNEEVSEEVDETEDEEDEEEAAESDEATEEESDEEVEAPAKKPKAKAKAKAAPRPRKARKPKAPPRMRARWGVFDAAMKQVAIFDYKDLSKASAKVAELLATRKTGTFFVQMVKEPMPEEPAVPAGVT